MKKEDVATQYTTPIGAPAFVKGPHRFTDREYFNITYRTDRDALIKVVPEPLEVDESLVRFEVMKMPDTTGYGAYVECGQAAVVRYGQERGEYLIGMYLDNLPAIAAGREISAFPKKLGSARLCIDSDTLSALWITGHCALRRRRWATNIGRSMSRGRGRKSPCRHSC